MAKSNGLFLLLGLGAVAAVVLSSDKASANNGAPKVPLPGAPTPPPVDLPAGLCTLDPGIPEALKAQIATILQVGSAADREIVAQSIQGQFPMAAACLRGVGGAGTVPTLPTPGVTCDWDATIPPAMKAQLEMGMATMTPAQLMQAADLADLAMAPKTAACLRARAQALGGITA